MKKLSQFLEVHISEMLVVIYLKFGMWGTNVGGHLHIKNRPVLYKHHKFTFSRKSHYCSSCQCTHWCGAPASCAARHTTVCLDPCASDDRVSHMNHQYGQSSDLALRVILSGNHTSTLVLIAWPNKTTQWQYAYLILEQWSSYKYITAFFANIFLCRPIKQ